MLNAPSNTDDIIDSRDVIARIEELTSERDALREEFDNEPANAGVDFDNWVRHQIGWGDDEEEELAALKALADQGEGYGDWEHGETLIHANYFTENAQQLAEDIGAIDPNASWPLSHIDWESAADELKIDYMQVDFDGETYWMRA